MSAAGWPQLTLVVAPAGSGKTHVVERATASSARVWITLGELRHGSELPTRLVEGLRLRVPGLPSALSAAVGPSCGPISNADPIGRAEQLGSLIARELDAVLHRDLVLVIDELERLADDPVAARLIEAVVRSAPPRLSVVLAGRVQPPFSIARLEGRLLEIGPADLTLARPDAQTLLADRWPDLPTATVDEIVRLARGVPGALVVLGASISHADPDERSTMLAELGRADRPVSVAVSRLWRDLPAAERRLVDDVAVIGQAGLADLQRLGHPDADKIVPGLLDRHLLTERPGHRDGAVHLGLTRLAATVVDLDPGLAAERALYAVQIALARADHSRALAVALDHGAPDLLGDTVRSSGELAIDDGRARTVLDAIATLGAPPDLAGLAGRAHQALGDWEAAIEAYRIAAGHATRAGEAWRHVLLTYFQGDTAEAAAVAARAIDRVGLDEPADDLAMLYGYGGSVAWLMGDLETARRHGEEALRLASAARDDAALAVAHTLAALVAASDGDRVNNDWSYVRALQHAERAGDVLQIARIRSNQASRLMEEGEYDAALSELDDAVRYADLGGYGAMLGLALTNRGEVLTKLGRLDDARTDLVTATELLQRQGSRIVGYPLVRLARLFLIRGDVEQARGSGERAMAISDPDADQQLGVAARVELAEALADREPDLAWEHANRAASASSSLDAAHAWSVVGMLALRRGDHEAAADAARTAAELARARRDRFALAHAIEVAALVTDDAAQRRAQLEEAYMLFDELRCPIEAARVELRLAAGRLDSSALARVAAVGDLARRLGARPLLAQVEEVLRRHHDVDDGAISVTALGSFAVRRGDETIPLTAWQSKKARDLFKMLVVRRGRPLARDQVIERLWPDDEPSKASSKLSVALATVRSVLDPDKVHPSEYYVRSDGDLIRLEVDVVATDVDRFVDLATEALREHRRSSHDRATSMLEAAEAAYAGDVFEDDLYADWYVSLREEARVLYLDVARALAGRRAQHGEIEDAIRLLLRVLEREPYDEQAHLDLVTSLTSVGRHGDARRRYQQYASKMRDLDIEPQPFPAAGGR